VLPLKDDNPTTTLTWVTMVLIVINVVVFVGPQTMLDRDITLEYAAIPCEVVTGEGLTDLEIGELYKTSGDDTACDLDPTGEPRFPSKPERLAMIFSMFMHGGWMHLIGNIWFLWIFGNNVEDHLGKVRYLAFYLLGGIAATLAHVAVQPDSIVPLVGASGAVAAVMGAYAIWFPNAPIKTLIFVIMWSVKAKWWLAFWLGSQFLIGNDSGIAWMAHVGGFVFGALVGLIVRMSKGAQKTAFTPPYQDQVDQPWDSTGGAGRGQYARPHRLFSTKG